MRTRLATTNRLHVSIRGQPCKTFLTCSLITVQNLLVAYTAWANVGGRKYLGDSGWGCTPFWRGRGWPLRNMLLLQRCYHAISVIVVQTVRV